MSSRTVAVVLRAEVNDYVSQMRAAQRHTTDVEKAARSATQQFAAHNEALTKVGVGMAAVGTAAAVGIGLAVKAAAEYGGKMAQLQSLSHGTTHEMQLLSDAAMKQGQAFGQSASQVADAEIELTKAGRTTADILGGDLKGALALAAAGQIDVAKATEIGVTALTQFSKSGATIPQVADALAAGADKALGSVEELGMALNQGGLVASQMGLDLNDTVGTLSAFAQAGLIGSDAGTSFKTMLLSLQSPSKQAQDALDAYNISAYDAQGNFVGIADLAGQLKTAFAGVDQASRDAALSTIFGSDAIRAANVLYTQGKTGIEGWIESVDDTGFASAQAAGKLNSLQGDVQKLSAAFQTDLIKAGSSADGAFRGIVQSGTAVVEMLGTVNPGVMAVGVGATTLVAGIGLLGGAFLIAVPKIAAMKVALRELNVSGRQAAGIFGKGAGLAAGVTLFASAIAATAQHGTADAQQIALAGEAIKSGWKGLDKVFDQGALGNAFTGLGDLKRTVQDLAAPVGPASAGKALDGLTLGITHFGDVYKSAEGQFDAYGQQLAGLAQQDYGRASASFAGLVKQYGLGQSEAASLLQLMPAFRDELIHQAEAAHVTASDQNLLAIAQQRGAAGAKVLAVAQANAAKSAAAQAEGIAGLRGEATDAQGAIKDLADTISGFGSATLDARAAQRDFRKSVADAKTALKDSKATDDDKQAALDGIARAGIASASALAKVPGGAKKAQAAIGDARDAFIAAAISMGRSRSQAESLADKLGLIPRNVRTAVALAGGQAVISAADQIKGKLNDLTNGVYTVNVRLAQSGSVNNVVPGGVRADLRRAAGGPIFGAGPKGVDSVYAILAPGEHVLTAAEVDRMGGQGAVSAFRADLMQAFANGGPVNAIDQAKNQASKAQSQADEYQRKVIAQKKKADSAQDAADAAQKRYENAQDAAQKISGKGSAARKHDAEVHVKELYRASQAAKKEADEQTKRIDEIRSKRDAARDDVKDATESVSQLRLDREDFVSAERRDPNRASTSPLTFVDQLRQMSRDGNYSDAKRDKFKTAANDYERSLARLTEQADAASKTLDDLKGSAKALHDAVAGSVTGSFGIAGAFTAAGSASSTSSFERDGIRYDSTSSGPGGTAASIAGYYASGAQTASQFADALQQLAGRGLNSTLLAELAQMGTEQGLPIARAILSGSSADLQTINAGYGGIAAAGDRAGSVVADANFAAQIAAADRNASAIQATITEQGLKLRAIIGQAFGLKGYASGTRSAASGIRWVGEDGPELLGFGGGEAILNAAASRQWVPGSPGNGAAAPQVMVQPTPVNYPDTITVRDLNGFRATMVVIADQRIAADASQDAVLMMGGAA